MCLDFVAADFVTAPSSTDVQVCFKFFVKTEDEDALMALYQDEIYSIRRIYHASDKTLSLKFGGTYPSGFHCFESIEDALKWFASTASNPSYLPENVVLATVIAVDHIDPIVLIGTMQDSKWQYSNVHVRSRHRDNLLFAEPCR